MISHAGDTSSTLIVIMASLALLGACAEDSVAPPIVKEIPKELEIHGDVRVDDYFWLRERENPDVIAHLEAKNEYTESALAESAGLRSRIFE